MRAQLRQREPQVDLIMDSGAFSAWKLGKPINLKEYTNFLLENQEWIKHGVALDVINPGRPEEAAQQGWANYKYMRKQGLKPIPVVHVGENLDWLGRYLDTGCDYIGLSSSSIVSRGQSDNWYAMAWSHLVDSSGRPIVKAHAFGEGRRDSLIRFPWQSSDTTTWIYSSQRTGTIQFSDSRRLAFRNDGYSTRATQDIGRMEGDEHDAMVSILTKHGIDPDLLQRRDSKSAFITRCYIAALYYMGLEAQVNTKTPILFRESYGFNKPTCAAPHIKGLHIPTFNLYLVAGNNVIAMVCLAAAKHRKMLTSYFYVTNPKITNQIRSYVYDPMGTCERLIPFREQLELLQENLLDAPRSDQA
jgi:hypothetical protein